jgi:hypothetical protein
VPLLVKRSPPISLDLQKKIKQATSSIQSTSGVGVGVNTRTLNIYLKNGPAFLPSKNTQTGIAYSIDLFVLSSKISYIISLRNMSMDQTNEKGFETPPGSLDSVNLLWLPLSPPTYIQ